MQKLRTKLEEQLDNFGEIKNIFWEHYQSEFLHDFLKEELSSIAIDPNHVVYNQIGHFRFAIINDKNFDYTIQLVFPTNYQRSIIQWNGSSQIIGIKGKGGIVVRFLKVPESIDINVFSHEFELEVLKSKYLSEGEILFCEGPNILFDLVSVETPIIIESLTIKRKSTLKWTFDRKNLKPISADTVTMLSSRLRTLLDVVVNMEGPIPRGLIHAIFESNDTRLKLRTIQEIFLKKDESAFDWLNESIESSNPILSKGSQYILNGLIKNKY